jgi:hypothetical protein
MCFVDWERIGLNGLCLSWCPGDIIPNPKVQLLKMTIINHLSLWWKGKKTTLTIHSCILLAIRSQSTWSNVQMDCYRLSKCASHFNRSLATKIFSLFKLIIKSIILKEIVFLLYQSLSLSLFIYIMLFYVSGFDSGTLDSIKLFGTTNPLYILGFGTTK